MMRGRRGLQLTVRDLALLRSVHEYRYLSTAQVLGLHFPSAQTMRRRLRLLGQEGYLTTFRAPGVTERIVMLANRGAEAVATSLQVPLKEFGWSEKRAQPKDYYFLQHFLGLNDFRIALKGACEQRSGVRLLGFIPEHRAARTAQRGIEKHIRDVAADADRPGEKITHTPDGVFALGRGGRAALFFLEVDRGTESLSHPERGFLKTIRFYLHYLVAGGHRRYEEDFRVAAPFRAFRVLIVTSSARRLENIRALGGRVRFEPGRAKRFIWLTTQDRVGEELLSSPCWVSLDPEDERSYAIVSSDQPKGD